MKRIMIIALALSVIASVSFAAIDSNQIGRSAIKSRNIANSVVLQRHLGDGSIAQENIAANSIGDTQLTTSVEGVLFLSFNYFGEFINTATLRSDGVIVANFNPAIAAQLTVSRVWVMLDTGVDVDNTVTFSADGGSTYDSLSILATEDSATLASFTNFATIETDGSVYISITSTNAGEAVSSTHIIIECRYAIKND